MSSSKSDNNEVFENLSSGISYDERHQLLERVKGISTEKDSLTAGKVTKYDDDYEYEFKEAFKKRSIFDKIAIWLWSFLTHSSVNDVLNKKLLASYAKKIEVSNPGLIEYERKIATNLFYEKLKQLNGAIDFFKPYMENYTSNSGDYYFLIGHIYLPEFEKTVYDETDPYKYPLDKEIPDSEKIKLKDNLKKKLSSMSVENKNSMTDVVRMFEWLFQLSKVSIDRLLTMFTKEGDSYECLFAFLRTDFEELVSILSNNVPLDDRIIEFFCLLASRNDVDLNSFRNSASFNLSVIENFAKNLPLEDLLRIIKNTSLYKVPARSYNVKWYDDFFRKWMSVFDERFAMWKKDFSREQVKQKIKNYFEMNDFPLFPSRPWQELGSGFEYSYELTIGIINAFMKQHFNTYNSTFQKIAVKGEFASKENLHEFNEAVDSFIKLHDELNILISLFSDKGDYYEEFRIYQSLKNKSSASTNRVHVIIQNFEQETLDMEERFCVMCQHLMAILEGLLSEKRTGKYCTLLNMNRLAADGVDFRDVIMDRLQGIIHIYEVVKDLELLEI